MVDDDSSKEICAIFKGDFQFIQKHLTERKAVQRGVKEEKNLIASTEESGKIKEQTTWWPILFPQS